MCHPLLPIKQIGSILLTFCFTAWNRYFANWWYFCIATLFFFFRLLWASPEAESESVLNASTFGLTGFQGTSVFSKPHSHGNQDRNNPGHHNNGSHGNHRHGNTAAPSNRFDSDVVFSQKPVFNVSFAPAEPRYGDTAPDDLSGHLV